MKVCGKRRQEGYSIIRLSNISIILEKQKINVGTDNFFVVLRKKESRNIFDVFVRD